MNEDDIIIDPTPLAASETSETVSNLDYTVLISDIKSNQDLLISLDFMQLFSLWVIVGVLLMILFRGR